MWEGFSHLLHVPRKLETITLLHVTHNSQFGLDFMQVANKEVI
jgi:hypothetical protein